MLIKKIYNGAGFKIFSEESVYVFNIKTQIVVSLVLFALFFSGCIVSDEHKKDMKIDKSERIEKRGNYFSSWDKNSDGNLDKSEFLGMIRSQQGTPPWERNPNWTPESQLESRMKRRDLNGDGLLSKEEFMKPVKWGKKK